MPAISYRSFKVCTAKYEKKSLGARTKVPDLKEKALQNITLLIQVNVEITPLETQNSII